MSKRPKYMIDGEYAPPTSPQRAIRDPRLPPDGSKIETVEDAEKYVRQSETYAIYLDIVEKKATTERDKVVAEADKYTPESVEKYKEEANEYLEDLDTVQANVQENITSVNQLIESSQESSQLQPTEAEKDAFGVSEAKRLTEEKGYLVSYDSESNQLFWSSGDEDRHYAKRDPYEGEQQHRVRERRQTQAVLDRKKAERQDYINAPDKFNPPTLRLETEEEMDLRGLAEAKIMSEEKGVPVTYDPETNMFSWAGEPEPPEPVKALDVPLHGPKEGSIGYQFREFVHSTFGPIVGPPLEAWDESLSGLSILYVDKSAQAFETSVNLALKGKPWGGFAPYMGGIVVSGVGSAIRGATLLVNPVGQIKGLQSMGSLIHPEYRSAFVSQVLSDPLKFSVDLGAGIVGGYAAGRLIGTGLTKLSEYRTQRFLNTYSADDFLPYEQQYKFPEEVTVLEDRWTMFKEKVNVVDDFGFPSQHMAKQQPGYRLSIPKKIDVDDVSIDGDFAPKQFSTASEGAVRASDRMTNPYLLIEDALKKGYRRTGGGLIQEFIPEGMGYTETWLRPTVIKAIPSSTFLPSVSVSASALTSASSASNLGLLGALSGAPGMFSSSPMSELKTKTITKPIMVQDVKVKQQVWLKPVSYTELVDINLPSLRIDLEPTKTKTREDTILKIRSFPNIADVKLKQSQDITQKSIQAQNVKQIQDLDTKQIQDLLIEPIQIEETNQRLDLIPSYISRSPPRRPYPIPRPRKPRQTRRRRRGLPPLGYETKKYKMPYPKDFTKLKRKKKMRLPKL